MASTAYSSRVALIGVNVVLPVLLVVIAVAAFGFGHVGRSARPVEATVVASSVPATASCTTKATFRVTYDGGTGRLTGCPADHALGDQVTAYRYDDGALTEASPGTALGWTVGLLAGVALFWLALVGLVLHYRRTIGDG